MAPPISNSASKIQPITVVDLSHLSPIPSIPPPSLPLLELWVNDLEGLHFKCLYEKGVVDCKGNCTERYAVFDLIFLSQEEKDFLRALFSERFAVSPFLKEHYNKNLFTKGHASIIDYLLIGTFLIYFFCGANKKIKEPYVQRLYKKMGIEDLFTPELLEKFNREPPDIDLRAYIQSTHTPESNEIVSAGKRLYSNNKEIIDPTWAPLNLGFTQFLILPFRGTPVELTIAFGLASKRVFRLEDLFLNLNSMVNDEENTLFPESHTQGKSQAIFDNLLGHFTAEDVDRIDHLAIFRAAYNITKGNTSSRKGLVPALSLKFWSFIYGKKHLVVLEKQLLYCIGKHSKNDPERSFVFFYNFCSIFIFHYKEASISKEELIKRGKTWKCFDNPAASKNRSLSLLSDLFFEKQVNTPTLEALLTLVSFLLDTQGTKKGKNVCVKRSHYELELPCYKLVFKTDKGEEIILCKANIGEALKHLIEVGNSDPKILISTIAIDFLTSLFPLGALWKADDPLLVKRLQFLRIDQREFLSQLEELKRSNNFILQYLSLLLFTISPWTEQKEKTDNVLLRLPSLIFLTPSKKKKEWSKLVNRLLDDQVSDATLFADTSVTHTTLCWVGLLLKTSSQKKSKAFERGAFLILDKLLEGKFHLETFDFLLQLVQEQTLTISSRSQIWKKLDDKQWLIAQPQGTFRTLVLIAHRMYNSKAPQAPLSTEEQRLVARAGRTLIALCALPALPIDEKEKSASSQAIVWYALQLSQIEVTVAQELMRRGSAQGVILSQHPEEAKGWLVVLQVLLASTSTSASEVYLLWREYRAAIERGKQPEVFSFLSTLCEKLMAQGFSHEALYVYENALLSKTETEEEKRQVASFYLSLGSCSDKVEVLDHLSDFLPIESIADLRLRLFLNLLEKKQWGSALDFYIKYCSKEKGYERHLHVLLNALLVSSPFQAERLLESSSQIEEESRRDMFRCYFISFSATKNSQIKKEYLLLLGKLKITSDDIEIVLTLSELRALLDVKWEIEGLLPLLISFILQKDDLLSIKRLAIQIHLMNLTMVCNLENANFWLRAMHYLENENPLLVFCLLKKGDESKFHTIEPYQSEALQLKLKLACSWWPERERTQQVVELITMSSATVVLTLATATEENCKERRKSALEVARRYIDELHDPISAISIIQEIHTHSPQVPQNDLMPILLDSLQFLFDAKAWELMLHYLEKLSSFQLEDLERERIKTIAKGSIDESVITAAGIIFGADILITLREYFKTLDDQLVWRTVFIQLMKFGHIEKMVELFLLTEKEKILHATPNLRQDVFFHLTSISFLYHQHLGRHTDILCSIPDLDAVLYNEGRNFGIYLFSNLCLLIDLYENIRKKTYKASVLSSSIPQIDQLHEKVRGIIARAGGTENPNAVLVASEVIHHEDLMFEEVTYTANDPNRNYVKFCMIELEIWIILLQAKKKMDVAMERIQLFFERNKSYPFLSGMLDQDLTKTLGQLLSVLIKTNRVDVLDRLFDVFFITAYITVEPPELNYQLVVQFLLDQKVESKRKKPVVHLISAFLKKWILSRSIENMPTHALIFRVLDCFDALPLDEESILEYGQVLQLLTDYQEKIKLGAENVDILIYNLNYLLLIQQQALRSSSEAMISQRGFVTLWLQLVPNRVKALEKNSEKLGKLLSKVIDLIIGLIKYDPECFDRFCFYFWNHNIFTAKPQILSLRLIDSTRTLLLEKLLQMEVTNDDATRRRDEVLKTLLSEYQKK